jgi:hypothetical protein
MACGSYGSIAPVRWTDRCSGTRLGICLQTRPSDRNRTPPDYELHKRDTSGSGWVYPHEEGWVPHDEAVHGPIDEELKPFVEGLDVIWVREVDPVTRQPVLPKA